MARPSPWPVWPPPRAKRSKTLPSSAFGTPGPASSTETRRCRSRCFAAIRIGGAPYLAAFAPRFVKTRPLDRERHPLRDDLEQVDLRPRETAWCERPDVEDAEGEASNQQGEAQHRLDPLLPEDRVVDFVGVDVDHHRPRLGGDPAGEARPEWDPDALLDLLLDAERSACDELVGVLVEQEDRAGVCLEDVPDPLQESLQQLVEAEMREGRVGDRLQAS